MGVYKKSPATGMLILLPRTWRRNTTNKHAYNSQQALADCVLLPGNILLCSMWKYFLKYIGGLYFLTVEIKVIYSLKLAGVLLSTQVSLSTQLCRWFHLCPPLPPRSLCPCPCMWETQLCYDFIISDSSNSCSFLTHHLGPEATA